MTLAEQLREMIAEHEASSYEERLLDTIGTARTEAEFAVAWLRWYFNDGATP